MTIDPSGPAYGRATISPMDNNNKSIPGSSANTPSSRKQTSLLSFFPSPSPKRTEREISAVDQSSNSPLKRGKTCTLNKEENLPSITSSFYEMRSDSEQEEGSAPQLVSETGILNFAQFKLDEDSLFSEDAAPRVDLAPHRSKSGKQQRKSLNDAEEAESQEANTCEERYKWLADIKDAQGHSSGDAEYDCRTLYIPKSAWAKFTPFERQYWEIKKDLLDTIVFFKKGKFYELYEMDADVGSKEFDLKMIDRVNMRMVGVPEATFEMWAARFVAAGYKVARVDQTETAVGKTIREKDGGAKEKGDKIIKRELTCILTAGTITEPTMLPSDMSSYCIAIKERRPAVHVLDDAALLGMAILDAATGTIQLCDFEDDRNRSTLETLLIQLQPREILLEKGRISPTSKSAVRRSAPGAVVTEALPDKEYPSGSKIADTLDKEGYFSGDNGGWPEDLCRSHDQQSASFEAFGALLHYLRILKLDRPLLSYANISTLGSIAKAGKGLVNKSSGQDSTAPLVLIDGQSLVNLDIIPTSLRTASSPADAKRGTLLGIVDHCSTSFGRRLINLWICHPLASAHAIRERQQAIECLLSKTALSGQLCQCLSTLPDLERALSRIHSGTIKLKDFIAAIDGFQKILQIKDMLLPTVGLVNSLARAIPSYEETIHYFGASFDRALAMKEGTVVPHTGVSKDYDVADGRYRQVQERLQAYLREQEALLGVRGLQYRDVGKEIYQLEVPVDTAVPREYMLMSKTKAAKRYWTPTIRSLVKEHAEWEERRSFALRDVYADLLRQFDSHTRSIWRTTVEQVARIDCLLSLTRASELMAYPKCLPQLTDEGHDGGGAFLDVTDLRHPCAADPASFIPNDIKLGAKGNETGDRVLLLTGPNMGGKSTLLRQVCLAVILAQIGCYVPASTCQLAPVDRIFTRLGANDNIIAGKSTFLVELLDAAKILKEATPRSLVILDELGRGTSTFDGMAIAHSVLLHLVRHSRPLTLFATHYRPLAMDCLAEAGVNCSYMNCLTDAGSKRVTFLYKLVSGVSPKSYGMNVAAMAGLPPELIEEADAMAETFDQELSLCLDAAYGKSAKLSLSRILCRKLINLICPSPSEGRE